MLEWRVNKSEALAEYIPHAQDLTERCSSYARVAS